MNLPNLNPDELTKKRLEWIRYNIYNKDLQIGETIDAYMSQIRVYLFENKKEEAIEAINFCLKDVEKLNNEIKELVEEKSYKNNVLMLNCPEKEKLDQLQRDINKEEHQEKLVIQNFLDKIKTSLLNKEGHGIIEAYDHTSNVLDDIHMYIDNYKEEQKVLRKLLLEKLIENYRSKKKK